MLNEKCYSHLSYVFLWNFDGKLFISFHNFFRLAYRYIKNNKDDEKFYPYLYQYVHLLKYSPHFI